MSFCCSCWRQMPSSGCADVIEGGRGKEGLLRNCHCSVCFQMRKRAVTEVCVWEGTTGRAADILGYITRHSLAELSDWVCRGGLAFLLETVRAPPQSDQLETRPTLHLCLQSGACGRLSAPGNIHGILCIFFSLKYWNYFSLCSWSQQSKYFFFKH